MSTPGFSNVRRSETGKNVYHDVVIAFSDGREGTLRAAWYGTKGILNLELFSAGRNVWSDIPISDLERVATGVTILAGALMESGVGK